MRFVLAALTCAALLEVAAKYTLFVADTDHNAIKQCGSDTACSTVDLGITIQEPKGIAFQRAENGESVVNLYITDTAAGRILRCSQPCLPGATCCTVIKELGTGSRPVSISLLQKTVAVSPLRYSKSVDGYVVANSDGNYVAVCQEPSGTCSTLTGGLSSPEGVAAFQVEAGWEVYIADTQQHHILSCKLPSTLVTTGIQCYTAYGKKGDARSGKHHLNKPAGIALGLSASGQLQAVYVADSGNNRICKYFPGNNECNIVASSFKEPKGVAPRMADNDDLEAIFVADTNNNRIMRCEQGQCAAMDSGMKKPQSLALLPFPGSGATSMTTTSSTRTTTTSSTKSTTSTRTATTSSTKSTTTRTTSSTRSTTQTLTTSTTSSTSAAVAVATSTTTSSPPSSAAVLPMGTSAAEGAGLALLATAGGVGGSLASVPAGAATTGGSSLSAAGGTSAGLVGDSSAADGARSAMKVGRKGFAAIGAALTPGSRSDPANAPSCLQRCLRNRSGLIMFLTGIASLVYAAIRGTSVLPAVLCAAISCLALFQPVIVKPDGTVHNVVVQMVQRGERVHPLFWAFVQLCFAIVQGIVILLGELNQAISWILAITAVFAGIARFMSLSFRSVSLATAVSLLGASLTFLMMVIAWGQSRNAVSDKEVLGLGAIIASAFEIVADGEMAGVSDEQTVEMPAWGTFHDVEDAQEAEVGPAASEHADDAPVVGTESFDASEDGDENGDDAPVVVSESFEAFRTTMTMAFKTTEVMGGFDTKSQEPPGIDGDEEKARAFTKFVQHRYRSKKMSLVEECQELLRVPLDKESPLTKSFKPLPSHGDVILSHPLTMKILAWRVEFVSILYGCFFKGAQHLCIFCMYLYSMQDCDIDRFLGFPDVPHFPEGKESPAERNQHYRRYRETVVRYKTKYPPRGARSPQMFQVANWGMRVSWDSFLRHDLAGTASWGLRSQACSKGAGNTNGADASWGTVENVEALHELDNYIKWTCTISCNYQTFDPPKSTYRGLNGLPHFLIEILEKKKAGDFVFWAAMSSTTTDRNIATHYAEQEQPSNKNVIFMISGVSQGLELRNLSRYPKEEEFLLPACSLLEVRKVSRKSVSSPLEIDVKFRGTLLETEFQTDVRKDTVASSEALFAGLSAAELDALRGAALLLTGGPPADHATDKATVTVQEKAAAKWKGPRWK